MIVVDTHIFVWWVHSDKRLTEKQIQAIQSSEPDGIGLSAISLWEISKLVERERLVLPLPIGKWFNLALSYPGVQVIHLTPEIVITSTQLPGDFHNDPADQMIVATAITLGCRLITSDARILAYPHLVTIY